jgi:hypothetical protein
MSRKTACCSKLSAQVSRSVVSATCAISPTWKRVAAGLSAHSSTFKGTRHPAGVIFCMRQEQEAAAIIASQDRRLSLAIKDARGVVAVLGSYERAFGWR